MIANDFWYSDDSEAFKVSWRAPKRRRVEEGSQGVHSARPPQEN